MPCSALPFEEILEKEILKETVLLYEISRRKLRNFSTKLCTHKHAAVSMHNLVMVYFFELLLMMERQLFRASSTHKLHGFQVMMNDEAAA